MPPGRPSDYTPQIAAKICEYLEDGVSLLSACRQLNLKESTVRTWTRDRPEFAANYARAREDGDDIEFERLAELQNAEPPLVEGRVDQGWVTWQRNRVDTAKWMLARKRPKKYGDKIDHEHHGKITLESLILGAQDGAGATGGGSDEG